MPKVILHNDGKTGRIIFNQEDFLSGFIPQYANNSNKKIGRGAAFMRETDPFRSLGYLAPGYNPKTDVQATAIIDAVQRNAFVNNVPTAFAYMCGGTKIHQMAIPTDTVTNDGTFPRTIAGSTMEDCIAYNIGSTTYGFYSYYNGTDLEIARQAFPSTFIDGYWKTTLAMNSTDQNVPHPMIIGKNGILYIGDGKDVASIDGTDGTANGTGTLSAVAVDLGYTITSFAATDKFLIIFAYKTEDTANPFTTSTFNRGQAKVYFWDMLSPKFYAVYDIDDNYVNGGFIWKNTIGCFTQGRTKGSGNYTSALRLFNGTSFEIPPENPIFNDNAPRHGGVEIYDNMVTWYADGKIYSYGSPFNDVPPAFVHRTSAAGTATGGMCKNLSGNKLYVSSGTTAAQGINTIGSNFHDATSWQSVMAEPELGEEERAEIYLVKTKFSGTASGGRSVALILRTDMGANTNITVFTGVTTVTVQTTAESSSSKRIHTYTRFNSAGARIVQSFSSLGIAISYATGSAATDAPIFSEITIYFRRVTV